MVIITIVFSWSRVQARTSIPAYYTERPTVKVYLSHELDTEERTGPFINTNKDTSTSRQKFEVKTRGWVYHPALLIFSAALKPEFKQQSIDTNGGDTQENDATFLGFNVDSTFLQYKPYTVKLYASKNRNDFASSLASDSASESSLYRGQLLLKYQPLPTTITVESNDQLTESFFITREKSEKVRVESKHQTLKSKTKLEAEFFEKTRNIRGTEFTGDRKFLYVNNQYKPGEKSNMFSGLRFFSNTSGAVDSTAALFNSQLSVRHRENLNTRYQVQIEDRDDGGFASSRKFGAAEMTHLLYENLTTTVSGDIDKNEFTDGDLDTYTAGIDLRYVRRIPWGKLNINLGHRERIEDDQRQVTFAEVRDESHVLTGTNLVLLANDVIDVSTIKVTDDTGLTEYVKDIDYIVTSAGTSVFISRNGVGIGDGDEVLVDYSFEPDPPAKTNTITDSFGISFDLWSMLHLFYQKSQSREKFISGIEPSELTDDTVQRTGAELRWKWSTTRVEVEDRDTTRTPTKLFRLSEALSFRPNRKLAFGFLADYNKLELIDTGEQSETTRFSINLQWDLGGAGRLSADGFSQQVTGSAQRSDRKGLKALYQWKYGAWQPSVRYALIDEVDQLAGESRKRNNILFSIEREF